MYNFTGAAADVVRRVVYPGLGRGWDLLRNLTGRRRRLRDAADTQLRDADKRRHLDSWARARGR
jgi:hypothetical protein